MHNYSPLNDCYFEGYISNNPALNNNPQVHPNIKHSLALTVSQNTFNIPCIAFNSLALKLSATLHNQDKIFIKARFMPINYNNKFIFRFVIYFLAILESNTAPVKLSFSDNTDLSNYL